VPARLDLLPLPSFYQFEFLKGCLKKKKKKSRETLKVGITVVLHFLDIEHLKLELVFSQYNYLKKHYSNQ